MKQSMDPFEAAFEEEDELPPASPDDIEFQNPASTSASLSVSTEIGNLPLSESKEEDEDDEEEEENLDREISKCSHTGDLDEIARTRVILSQFTEEQMDRYEAFRRSAFKNMKRLLTSIAGTHAVNDKTKIVVSAIAKMFVGELVETARMVMRERNESGPIRPLHIREAYRRLKLEGKVPKRSVPRLFR